MANAKHPPQARSGDLRLSALPGLFLASVLILQTAGLRYTTVTNSGFITTLYVVFVPLTEWIVFGRKISARFFGILVVSLLGAMLMSGFSPLGGKINIGDALTLACAIISGFHIVTVSRIAKKIHSPFAFNVFQSLWAGVFSLTFAIFLDSHFQWPFESKAAIGLLFLGLASTLFAFYLQVRVQRVLPAALTSVFFLLESPFAAAFAYFLFHETLSSLQWAGAALILLSTIFAAREETNS